MNPAADHEAHALPLADRLVDGIIRTWLNTAHGVASATADPKFSDYERGQCAGIDQVRQYLDNYWYTVTPQIIDALRRAGLMTEVQP